MTFDKASTFKSGKNLKKAIADKAAWQNFRKSDFMTEG